MAQIDSTPLHSKPLALVRRRRGASPALQAAADDLGAVLMALEAGVEQSLRQSADLVIRVIDERANLNLSLMYGQAIIDEALKVAAHTAQARSATVGLHSAMNATQDQLGVRASLLNPGSKPTGSLSEAAPASAIGAADAAAA